MQLVRQKGIGLSPAETDDLGAQIAYGGEHVAKLIVDIGENRQSAVRHAGRLSLGAVDET